MDSTGKARRRYAAARMPEEERNTQNRGIRVCREDSVAVTLKPKSVLSSVVGVLALSSGAAGAQVLGEQTTMLTAYVTEQATLSLPSRASSVSLASGQRALAGSVGVKSHRGAEDFRNFRVIWGWIPQQSGFSARPATSRRVILPLSGNIEAAGDLPLRSTDSADSSGVVVKIESFEL